MQLLGRGQLEQQLPRFLGLLIDRSHRYCKFSYVKGSTQTLNLSNIEMKFFAVSSKAKESEGKSERNLTEL